MEYDLELVSFKSCPYVQRSVITLLHKQVPHKITYIDLADPPAWFKAISPLGKVPVVRVKDAAGAETVLFESAVINAFVDEVTPGSLLPESPLERAVDRAWIEMASEANGAFYQACTTRDAGAFEGHLAALANLLDRVEEQLAAHGGTFWRGDEMSLVDTSWAPILMRLEMLADIIAVPGSDRTHVAAWTKTLLALPEVRDSVTDELDTMTRGMIRGAGGHLSNAPLLAST